MKSQTSANIYNTKTALAVLSYRLLIGLCLYSLALTVCSLSYAIQQNSQPNQAAYYSVDPQGNLTTATPATQDQERAVLGQSVQRPAQSR